MCPNIRPRHNLQGCHCKIFRPWRPISKMPRPAHWRKKGQKQANTLRRYPLKGVKKCYFVHCSMVTGVAPSSVNQLLTQKVTPMAPLITINHLAKSYNLSNGPRSVQWGPLLGKHTLRGPEKAEALKHWGCVERGSMDDLEILEAFYAKGWL